jgi:hypothetical protein
LRVVDYQGQQVFTRDDCGKSETRPHQQESQNQEESYPESEKWPARRAAAPDPSLPVERQQQGQKNWNRSRDQKRRGAPLKTEVSILEVKETVLEKKLKEVLHAMEGYLGGLPNQWQSMGFLNAADQNHISFDAWEASNIPHEQNRGWEAVAIIQTISIKPSIQCFRV